jgi:hypothetical protein
LREVIRYGGDVSEFIPKAVAEKVALKFAGALVPESGDAWPPGRP